MSLIARLRPYFGWDDLMAALIPKGNKSIAQFEQAFADKMECEHGTMFAHGRTGLYTLFKIWGLENDEIIAPAYTCVVVQHAISLSDNIPVFVDSAKGSWNMDYDLLEAAITEKTRCIVVTHLFGYPMDPERVQEIVKRAEEKYQHKIYVVQDCAHSFGAKWNGELVTKYGDAAIFGLNISKVLSSVFGGMVITNSSETDKALKEYRAVNNKHNQFVKSIMRLIYLVAVLVAFQPIVYGFINWLERSGFLDRFVKYFEDDKIYFPEDWDTMPTQLEARVGLNQLKKYDEIIRRRKINAEYWMDRYKDDDSIEFLPNIEGSTFSHCVALIKDRQTWEENLRKEGYQLGILIEYSVPEMRAYQSFKRGEYPVSVYYSEHTINFPNHPNLLLA